MNSLVVHEKKTDNKLKKTIFLFGPTELFVCSEFACLYYKQGYKSQIKWADMFRGWLKSQCV
jgi:hypothetical protein